jgi:hypothetical protein
MEKIMPQGGLDYYEGLLKDGPDSSTLTAIGIVHQLSTGGLGMHPEGAPLREVFDNFSDDPRVTSILKAVQAKNQEGMRGDMHAYTPEQTKVLAQALYDADSSGALHDKLTSPRATPD